MSETTTRVPSDEWEPNGETHDRTQPPPEKWKWEMEMMCETRKDWKGRKREKKVLLSVPPKKKREREKAARKTLLLSHYYPGL
jgi:hypothetical protein